MITRGVSYAHDQEAILAIVVRSPQGPPRAARPDAGSSSRKGRRGPAHLDCLGERSANAGTAYTKAPPRHLPRRLPGIRLTFRLTAALHLRNIPSWLRKCNTKRFAEVCLLYFIRHGRRDVVKIGYSADPIRRLAGLQTSSPDRLSLLGVCPGDREDEAALHQQLAHLHKRGEWFRDTAELRAAVKELCTGHRLYGRCPRCGVSSKPLHDPGNGPGLVCSDCDPPGLPQTLRRSRETADRSPRCPAGGGYRILRK